MEADAVTLDFLAAHLDRGLEQVADLTALSPQLKRRLEKQLKSIKAEAVYLARGLRLEAKLENQLQEARGAGA